VIALTSPYIWYTSRVSGVIALVMLTLVIVLGILISTRVGGRRVGRFEITEMHRSISLIAMIFVGIHVVTTVIDTYVNINWISAVVPMTSSYKRLPVAIGTVAIDFMLAVWLSSQLKERLDPRAWRAIHFSSYASFVAAAIHSYLVGTDERSLWGLVVLGSCVAMVLLATLWRIVGRPERAVGRTALSPLEQSRGRHL
jgi:methionine sulfoxide reductase heme-binding subunit